MARTPTSPGINIIPPQIEVYKNRVYGTKESAKGLEDRLDLSDIVCDPVCGTPYYFSGEFYCVSDPGVCQDNLDEDMIYSDLDELARGLHTLGYRDTADVSFPRYSHNDFDDETAICYRAVTDDEKNTLQQKLRGLVPPTPQLKLVWSQKETRS